MAISENTTLRVGLLVDEFFGGWRTAIGGYGALARNYICRYIPNEEIAIDLLMNTYGGITQPRKKTIDGTDVYQLPRHRRSRERWLVKQQYDLFLSIEMTEASLRILQSAGKETPLLFWIQDPRDLQMYQARLNTVHRLRDGDWAYTSDVARWLHQAMQDKRVTFCSQGSSLTEIARTAYDLPINTEVLDLPNPVTLDTSFSLKTAHKRDKVIFLGRLEAQKRAWIFCEIARSMPQYDFYVLGATGRGRNKKGNAKTLEAYRKKDGSSKIPNLHFCGHVDGVEKRDHLQTAKLLVNTSIWEGIPVSWLEALSYGTLIVSSFERDAIVERFGTFVGEVMGDGLDLPSIQKFVDAIDHWMKNETRRNETAQNAIDFIKNRHSLAYWQTSMRNLIKTCGRSSTRGTASA